MKITRSFAHRVDLPPGDASNKCSWGIFALAVILCVTAATECGLAAPRAVNDPIDVGRALLGTLSCTACHAPSEAQASWLLPKMAPRLAGISARVNGYWLRQYLASPHETMPGTTMPDLLGALTAADRQTAADALTHFLLSRQPATFRSVMPDRAAVSRGQALYHRIGCVACHSPQDGSATTSESVPLPHMVEKWSFDGLRRFLLDPLATRPSGRMPAMRLTDQEAADIAHYLLRETRVPAALELATYRGQFRSLDDIDAAELVRTEPVTQVSVDPARRDRGGALQYTGWLQVDQPGEYTFYFTAEGAGRFSLDGSWRAGENSWERARVDEKVKLRLNPGLHALRVDYIHRGNKPSAVLLEWEKPGGMRESIPTSQLRSVQEIVNEPTPFVVNQTKAAAGRVLYSKMNCAACHEPKAAATSAPQLAMLNVERGCLIENPPAVSPNFHLDAAQRAALSAAVGSINQPTLAAPSPQQRVVQTMAAFRCGACHQRDGVGGVAPDRDRFFTSAGQDVGEEGRIPPRLDGVGNKLKPAWIEKVLVESGAVRPYLDTRMPQFGRENVGHLAELFVAVDRQPQKLPAVTDALDVQKAAGRKMVGTDGGLSCIACHRFNRQPAQVMQIIDLASATERLNEDWFRQFLLDPNRFHPGTRMPSYWANRKSALPALLGGDTDRQFAALWNYLADGPRARFPEGLSRQNLELVVGGDAVVYRGKLWEAGFRAVAIGYPGQVNAAFDAEEMRLSLLWRGRFLNAGPHWTVQGMGQIRPLGTDIVVFPHGSPFAVLADVNAPWPTDSSKELGMKFLGYQLDPLKRPTLLYEFRTVNVEDFFAPLDNGKMAGLRRTLSFTTPPLDGLYVRLAVGKLTHGAANSWRINDAMTLAIAGGGTPLVRGAGDQQELLVPLHFAGGKNQLEVEYGW